ncbi:hypothetical protein [Nocardia sp. NPDC057227]|uniref:hypothetical protein n=1 Tax=Nocardia sp. NPDC057227 TaxID=3346056 RepID=UPI0036414169
MWWTVGLALLAICAAVWWLLHYVGWRDDPGRHAAGHVDPVSRDVDFERTDILPIVREHDPTRHQLARAVRRWQELT